MASWRAPLTPPWARRIVAGCSISRQEVADGDDLVFGGSGAAAGASVGGGVLGLSLGADRPGRSARRWAGRSTSGSSGRARQPVETGRVERFRVTGASEGAALARLYGRMRRGRPGDLGSSFREDGHDRAVGGKGGAPRRRCTEYSYTVSLAVALCEGEISRRRADLGRRAGDRPGGADAAAVYPGAEDQLADPPIEAVEGAGRCRPIAASPMW